MLYKFKNTELCFKAAKTFLKLIRRLFAVNWRLENVVIVTMNYNNSRININSRTIARRKYYPGRYFLKI